MLSFKDPVVGSEMWAPRDSDLGVTSIAAIHEVMGMNSSLGKKRV